MRRLILVIFLLSGAAGLIYEVVWARQLVLVFGNTTQAVSAILTGFFGGMAIGSVVGGRLADRVRRTLRLYGILELVLVLVVLATPITFGLLREVYRGAYGSLETAPVAIALVRFMLSLVALGPATVLMGATLPTLTRFLSHDASELSGSFGRLYAANTVGAIAGTVMAGFVLIELLGLTGALVVGAACSATAGVGALLMDRRLPGSATSRPDPSLPSPVQGGGAAATTLRPRRHLAMSLAFVSGLTSLGYQVLWTRLLASGTGNSTYVFSTILALFLTGIALGAVTFSLIRRRITDTVSLLAVGQVSIAVIVLLGLILGIGHDLTGALPLTVHFSSLVTHFVGPVAVIVLPATFVMGLTFPAASALMAGADQQVGSSAGSLLAANTAGAIVATFLIPFLVVPLIGSPSAVALLAAANGLVGLVLVTKGTVQFRVPRLLTGLAGTASAALVVYGLAFGGLFVDPNISYIRSHGGQVLGTAEDEIASVQAGSIKGFKQLWVTGTSMTALTVDAKLMPILPLALRPLSRTELTIAFGMGTAFRASLIAGLKTDAVELVPSVPAMFGDFYPDASSVLANPNGHVIIADGRNYVELTDSTYDIIVVDPPPPIESSGVSVISSLEFYQAARARLNPGGVMMQWVPFGQTLDEFRAHVRTFRAVFANVIVARGPSTSGIYMLGSDQPLAFQDAITRAILARSGVVADLSSAFDSPVHDLAAWATLIPSLVRLSGDQVAAFAGPGPLITDDHPLPEYFLLRHLLGAKSPPLTVDLVRPPGP